MTQSAYSASGIITNGATTNVQDIITIGGGSSVFANIVIIRFKLTATVTPSQRVTVSALRRSTADSGGVFVAASSVPAASALSPAAATAVGHYTSNPTQGTLVGAVKAANVLFGKATDPSDEVEWELDVKSGLHIVLKGSSEQLCVNLNGASFSQNPTIVWELHWLED